MNAPDPAEIAKAWLFKASIATGICLALKWFVLNPLFAKLKRKLQQWEKNLDQPRRRKSPPKPTKAAPPRPTQLPALEEAHIVPGWQELNRLAPPDQDDARFQPPPNYKPSCPP